jgi:protein TonB
MRAIQQERHRAFAKGSRALTAPLLSEADFTAEPVERLDGAETPTPAERRGLAVALIAAAVLHLLIPLALFLYYAIWPPAIPTAVQEIPIEVVVEQPPPPKPKQAEDKPKPPPKPFEEKPAFDAPAPETKEKVNRESPDKTTKAPAAQTPPPPTPGAPPKSETQPPEPVPEPAPTDEQKAQNVPAAQDLTTATEGELPTNPSPKPKDETAESAARAAPQLRPKAPVGEPLPTIEDLPQYKFAREVEHSPIAGGNAESRYLTIVYGMIKAHLHEGPELHVDTANKRGMVDFYVDEGGNLVGHKLVSSSGSPNLDIAVMNAIAAAAPYPAPPNWRPLYLTYNFGKR